MAALLALVAPALAADEGIHLEGDKTTSLTWTVTDKLGCRWDIAPDGTVADGTNDAYDGGLRLRVGGNGFGSFGSAKINAAGDEIEIGPWSQSGLNVWRRIRVDKEAATCRWIDIYQNTSPNEVTVALQYYSNMGDPTNATTTTSGKADLSDKDWGIVTAAGTGESSRPAVAHVFATPAAKLRPTFRFERGNDNLYCDVSLKVPANGAVALCFYEAQRRPYAEAVKFLKEFSPDRETRKIPRDLRRILANMTGASLALGGVELTRNDKADLAVLTNGDELMGTITNTEFALEALGGKVTFPAAEVVGIVSTGGEDGGVRVVLTTGEVVAGKLAGGKIALRLTGGTALDVPVKGLVQAAYRVTAEKPESMTSSLAMVVLRTGPILAFEDADRTFRFQTAYGDLTVSASDLKSIEMDTPGSALHRMIFSNGSVLAGLLAEETISLKLRIGLPLETPSQTVRRFIFPADAAAAPTELAKLTLRNADTLLGRIADETWTVKSKLGTVPVKCETIAEAVFSDDSLGQVKVSLRDGTKLGGKLEGDYVRFRIEPGPELKLFVGHLVNLTAASGAAGDKPAEPVKPAPGPSTAPTTRSARDFPGPTIIP